MGPDQPPRKPVGERPVEWREPLKAKEWDRQMARYLEYYQGRPPQHPDVQPITDRPVLVYVIVDPSDDRVGVLGVGYANRVASWERRGWTVAALYAARNADAAASIKEQGLAEIHAAGGRTRLIEDLNWYSADKHPEMFDRRQVDVFIDDGHVAARRRK